VEERLKENVGRSGRDRALRGRREFGKRGALRKREPFLL